MKTKLFNQTTNGALLLTTIIFLLALYSCEKEDLAINEYLLSLPSWNNFSPSLDDANKDDDQTQVFSCEDKMVRSITPCSITRTPKEIVTFDPNSEILYLGSLIQGDSYVGGLGSMQSLPIYQRAPLTVSISFQMENNNREVQDPNLSSVKQAIGELVEAAQEKGHISGSSIFFDQKTSYSLEQTALALNLSVNYMVGSAKSSLEWESTTEKNTVSAYFIQKMFTVSMGNPQQPGDLFSDDFTQEILDEQISMGRIGPENPPVYVSNIVYGRMMTLTMTSSKSVTEMKASLQASYGAIEGGLEQKHKDVLEESTIRLVTIGGDAQSALDYLRTGTLGEFFRKDAPLTTAVPISYTLRNLRDNDIAKVSQTVDYDMVQYETVDVEFFNDEAMWIEAVGSINDMKTEEWKTTETNMDDADESNDFVAGPDGQIFMGPMLTLEGENTTLPFSFYLKNTGIDLTSSNIERALVYNDRGEGWVETISIGNMGEFEDDDFEIGISTGNVYAIAFTMVDNQADPGEYFEVFTNDGTEECRINFNEGDFNNFIGVLSPVPITKIHFNESENGDDIGIKNFKFGYKKSD
jgi:hypothetical protein